MTDNRLTTEELNSFSEWLQKFLEEAAHHQETIKRQKAEIERLQNTIIALVNYLDILGVDKTDTSLVKEAYELNAQIRAAVKDEAFKEFAERLKEISREHSETNARIVYELQIDNLLKERVGDTK